MRSYDSSHVGCTAVGHFYCVSVEDRVEFVVRRKVLVDKFKERATNVGLNRLVEGWIKPCDGSGPDSGFWWLFAVLDFL